MKKKRVSADKRRRQIIESAMKLFSKKGFKGTTTKDIAQKVLMSESMLYRHFKTKEGKIMTLKAEAILVAAGRSPNVMNMGLETIGVEFDKRGIKVDNRLRTNLKHIYAAGDVNGGYQFTHAAGYEGGIVIKNTIFHLPGMLRRIKLNLCIKK